MHTPSRIAALVALLVLVAGAPRAEELIDLSRAGLRGHSGPRFKVGPMNGGIAVLGGGGLGMIERGPWHLGLHLTSSEAPAQGVRLTYGSVEGGYTFFESSPVHLVLRLGLGGGVVLLDSTEGVQATGLVTAEPEVNVSFDVMQTFRLQLGVTGRLAVPTSRIGALEVSHLSGPTAVLGLQYGFFKEAPTPRGPLFLTGYYLALASTFAGLRLGVLDGGGTQLVVPMGAVWFAAGVQGFRSVIPFVVDEATFSLAGGGLRAEVVVWPRSLVHVSFGLALGGGVLSGRGQVAGILMALPDAELRLRLADFVQLGLVVGGRVTVPLSTGLGLDIGAASGVTAGVRLRFGAFTGP
jgi:hypothetical protein